jgi:hypothetical protein
MPWNYRQTLARTGAFLDAALDTLTDTLKWPPNGHLRMPNRQGFWPGTETGENISRRPLRVRVHQRPTDHTVGDPPRAGVRCPAGLDPWRAGEGGR